MTIQRKKIDVVFFRRQTGEGENPRNKKRVKNYYIPDWTKCVWWEKNLDVKNKRSGFTIGKFYFLYEKCKIFYVTC